VPEFIHWSSLALNVIGQNPNVIGCHETFVTRKSRISYRN
jgi:hypothetical protein